MDHESIDPAICYLVARLRIHWRDHQRIERDTRTPAERWASVVELGESVRIPDAPDGRPNTGRTRRGWVGGR